MQLISPPDEATQPPQGLGAPSVDAKASPMALLIQAASFSDNDQDLPIILPLRVDTPSQGDRVDLLIAFVTLDKEVDTLMDTLDEYLAIRRVIPHPDDEARNNVQTAEDSLGDRVEDAHPFLVVGGDVTIVDMTATPLQTQLNRPSKSKALMDTMSSDGSMNVPNPGLLSANLLAPRQRMNKDPLAVASLRTLLLWRVVQLDTLVESTLADLFRNSAIVDRPLMCAVERFVEEYTKSPFPQIAKQALHDANVRRKLPKSKQYSSAAIEDFFTLAAQQLHASSPTVGRKSSALQGAARDVSGCVTCERKQHNGSAVSLSSGGGEPTPPNGIDERQLSFPLKRRIYRVFADGSNFLAIPLLFFDVASVGAIILDIAVINPILSKEPLHAAILLVLLGMILIASAALFSIHTFHADTSKIERERHAVTDRIFRHYGIYKAAADLSWWSRQQTTSPRKQLENQSQSESVCVPTPVQPAGSAPPLPSALSQEGKRKPARTVTFRAASPLMPSQKIDVQAGVFVAPFTKPPFMLDSQGFDEDYASAPCAVLLSSQVAQLHTVLIGIEGAEQRIFLWNPAAQLATGIGRNDVIGKQLCTLMEEKDYKILSQALDAVHTSNVLPEPVRVQFCSVVQGFVTLRLTPSFGRLTDSTGEGMGDLHVVFIGSAIDDAQLSNLAFLHRYRTEELSVELSQLPPSPEWVMCSSLLKRSRWDTLLHSALAINSWTSTTVEQLVANLFNIGVQVEICRSHNVPQSFECAADTISRTLLLVVKRIQNGCAMQIRKKPLMSVAALEFEFVGSEVAAKVGSIVADQQIAQSVSAAGGSMQATTKLSSLLLRFPYSLHRPSNDAILQAIAPKNTPALGSVSPTTSMLDAVTPTVSSLEIDTGIPSTPFTMLLYEPSLLYRQQISNLIWRMGHALVVVSSDTQIELLLKSNVREIHAAIVDIDTKQSPQILSVLRRYPRIAVVTTQDSLQVTSRILPTKPKEGVCSVADLQNPLLSVVKPVDSVSITRTLENLRKIVLNRRTAEFELAEQRRLLNLHRDVSWKKLEKLGSGTSGDVFLVQNTLTGARMAMKTIFVGHDETLKKKKSTASSGGSMVDTAGQGAQQHNEVKVKLKDLLNEIDIMCTLVHPNIVFYFFTQHDVEAGVVNLYMELCQGGNIASLFRNQPQVMTLETSATIIRQLLLALEYLHARNITHRDIKPENVLLSAEGGVKLSDFGTAIRVEGVCEVAGTVGTLRYMAPEIVRGMCHGPSCDIWSVGVIVMEIIGILPDVLQQARLAEVLAFYQSVDDLGSLVSTDRDLKKLLSTKKDVDTVHLTSALQFCESCLQIDPEKRPDATQLLMHPFVASVVQKIAPIQTSYVASPAGSTPSPAATPQPQPKRKDTSRRESGHQAPQQGGDYARYHSFPSIWTADEDDTASKKASTGFDVRSVATAGTEGDEGANSDDDIAPRRQLPGPEVEDNPAPLATVPSRHGSTASPKLAGSRKKSDSTASGWHTPPSTTQVQ